MAKLTHLTAFHATGRFNASAACGRLVNWLSCTSAIEQVTCDRCHAAAQKAALEELTATTAKEA